MPSVSVLPSSPGLGGFHPQPMTAAKTNGINRSYDDMSVADITAAARDHVQRETRGATALSMIKIARQQMVIGKDSEATGNLKGALAAYTKAAALAKSTLDSAEMKAESGMGKGGVLRKEFNEFMMHEGSDLVERTQAIEGKLKAYEKAPASQNGRDGPPRTIADRLRSLQDNGMTVATTKRISSELPLSPPSTLTSFPESRNAPTSTPPSNRISVQLSLTSLTSLSPPSTQPSFSSSTSTSGLSSGVSTASTSSQSSPHAFVSPSTLGPPSPSSPSSPSSSPQLAHDAFSLSEFAQAFPPIDELEASEAFKMPTTSPHAHTEDDAGRFNKSEHSPDGFGNFAVPVERPSSTPLTPIVNSFTSRPASPSPSRSPLSPILNSKPSTLGLSNLGINTALATSSGSPSNPLSIPPTPVVDKPPIPTRTNIVNPTDLQVYINHYKVLLLDVRNRADFEREHIKHIPVVCIEPTVLMRDSITAKKLEDSLVIAPSHESVVFVNREKFDLVVFYDQNSTSFGPPQSPISVLMRAIYEDALHKMLRRVPMLLIGGLDRWKEEMGDSAVRRTVEDKAGAVNGVVDVGVKMNGLINGSIEMNGHGSDSSSYVTASRTPVGSPPGESLQQWQSRPRSETTATSIPFEQRTRTGILLNGEERRMSISTDHVSHSRSPAETSSSNYQPTSSGLVRRPALSRPPISASPNYSINNLSHSVVNQSLVNGSPPITYPQFPRHITPNNSGSITGSSFVSPPPHYDIASPPQASINPSFPRRRSDYVDQSQEALSGLGTRLSIDYPDLSTQIPRPPPVASPPIALDRQENHNRSIAIPGQTFNQSAPVPPKIKQDYTVIYWSDTQIGTSGLKNMGNTCYMNAPIQCLSATVPFAQFFTNGRWKDAINMLNKMGSQGRLVQAFASLLRSLWQGDLPHVTPIDFRRVIVQLNQQYSGSDQHDSQEFLSFLLDIIHEDLNRVITKPAWTTTPEQEAELERLPQQIASDREWRAWRMRHESLIVDYFQGQLRNRLQCLTCNQTSTTYNVFSMLQLPVPSRGGKIHLQKCLDAFFNTEVMEKDDAWECPRCRAKRKASKQLSLARLPPILLIHLKRFETRGRFSDKIDTFVEYPLKSLDLTNLMPPPLPPGIDKGQMCSPLSPDDPRTQLPPYKYDLYGVTNHYGNLSSGHYTAYIASRGGWVSCDDSSIRPMDPKQVVNQKAYVLFYKRVKA